MKTKFLLAAALISASAQAANNFPVKDANGTTINKASKEVSTGIHADKNLLIRDSDNAAINPATSENQASELTKLDTLHTDLVAASGASEVHVGEVGGNQTLIAVAQTVTASSAYATGNAIGGLITFANAARVSAAVGSPGTSGLVQSVIVASKSAQTTAVDLVFFNANPTASTCTDKAAFSLAAADFDKAIGTAHVTDWTASAAASFGQAQQQAIPYALASSTTLYACAVARGTPTFASTSDVTVIIRPIRN